MTLTLGFRSRETVLGLAILVVCTASASAQTGGVSSYRVFLDLNLTLPHEGDEFGRALTVGDFDADGFEDLAVGIPRLQMANGVRAGGVQILYGGTVSGVSSRNQLWTQGRHGTLRRATDGDRYGRALASGDFNGDGFDDLAIGIEGSRLSGIENAGAVEILYGSQDGLRDDGSYFLLSKRGILSPNDGFGALLASDDFDADGRDDLVVTSSVAVEVFFGTTGRLGDDLQLVSSRAFFPSRPTKPASMVLTPQLGILWFFELVTDEYRRGFSSLATGDLNGDGFADLALGAPSASGQLGSETGPLGAVEVFFGARLGFQSQSQVIRPRFPYFTSNGELLGLLEQDVGYWEPMFGSALSSGDFDGDGVDDLAIGAPGANGVGMDCGGLYPMTVCPEQGGVIVLAGSSGGLDESPVAVVRKRAFSGYALHFGSLDVDLEEDLVFCGHGDGTSLDTVERPNLQVRTIDSGMPELMVSLAAGDFDGDGQDELVAGFPYGSVRGYEIGFLRVYSLQ